MCSCRHTALSGTSVLYSLCAVLTLFSCNPTTPPTTLSSHFVILDMPFWHSLLCERFPPQSLTCNMITDTPTVAVCFFPCEQQEGKKSCEFWDRGFLFILLSTTLYITRHLVRDEISSAVFLCLLVFLECSSCKPLKEYKKFYTEYKVLVSTSDSSSSWVTAESRVTGTGYVDCVWLSSRMWLERFSSSSRIPVYKGWHVTQSHTPKEPTKNTCLCAFNR